MSYLNRSTHNIRENLTFQVINDIEIRAKRVSSLLRKSANTWLEIASEVYDAKQKVSPHAFQIFLQKSSLTSSISDKLCRIAKDASFNSDEMKHYLNKIDGWSTLYEITKLNSTEKKTLLDELNKNPDTVVSRAFVQRFRNSGSNNSKTELSLVQIKISEKDISRFDYDQFLELKERIDDISRIIDRMSPVINLVINNKNISNVENQIITSNHDISSETDKTLDEFIDFDISASNTSINNTQTTI